MLPTWWACMIRCRHEFHTPWIGPNITQTPHSHIKLHFAKYSAPLLFGGGSQLPAEATPNRLTDPRSVNHHNRDLPTTTQPKQKNKKTTPPENRPLTNRALLLSTGAPSSVAGRRNGPEEVGRRFSRLGPKRLHRLVAVLQRAAAGGSQ